MKVWSFLSKSIANPENTLTKFKKDIEFTVNNIQRKINSPVDSSEYVNKNEMRIIGLRRTGNHAITNWIIKQQTGNRLYVNNIRAETHPYRFIYRHYSQPHFTQEALGNFATKDYLIYSYEDYGLSQITNPKFEEKHDFFFGKSKTRYDILILRDPFNLLASRLKKNFMDVQSPNHNFIDLWISYAKEFLNETNYLQNNKICINYNQWYLDRDYRKQIASQLKLNFSDAGINDVMTCGGGSSFDQQKFNKQANSMQVLDRWKYFVDNLLFRKLLDNPELWHYSDKIFGKNPELEKLL